MASPTEQGQPVPAAQDPEVPLKVLVVDDTATNRQILQVFLRKLGFQVDVAVDGAQAVERFSDGNPDLVLMDVMMPVMDGYEATRRIKALCGDGWVPVVFLSALDKEESLVMGLDAGGDDYLHKPVNFVVLDAKLRSLKRAIRLQRALDENRRRTQAISDNVIDGIITIDERGIIQTVNAATTRIFGHAAEEMIGHDVGMLMPGAYRSAHSGQMARYLAGGTAHLVGKGARAVEGLRKNGTAFPLDVGITELRFEGRRLFVGIVRDVTEARAAERLLHENATRLQQYHDTQEEENALAQRIMDRQMSRPSLSDPLIRHWIAPAANFSGDVIAAARTPEGHLCVLLADATGHGLAAAISTLPVLTVFYGHVEQGYPLGYIVKELNRYLCATMPSGRFVAASLLCVDEGAQRARLWQGGMPDILLLDAQGGTKTHFAAQHLPLGIVEFDEDMAAITEIELQPDDQFVLFSDGLIEAADAAGEQFGLARLQEVLAKAPAAQRLDAVRASVYAHAGLGQLHDDVSLLLVGA
ncbi:MAG: SpoIIE family protein phosphatase [Rhodocyclaceae bacterium]|nr:SpoIIE family protein phosphatase [Rhodocyclaceae bacterium]